MDDPIPLGELVLRLSAAAATGALLGWEREWRNKPAGLRTHMMVALGSAVFMTAAIDFAATTDSGSELRLDPLRVLQGIIGGVGFLGAGAIIQSGGSVRGLTTAATIWLSAAGGIACGMGQYRTAGTAVGLGLIVLVLFGLLEVLIFRHRRVLRDDSPGDAAEGGPPRPEQSRTSAPHATDSPAEG